MAVRPLFSCVPCQNEKARQKRVVEMNEHSEPFFEYKESKDENWAKKWRDERKHLDLDDFRKEWKKFVAEEFERISSNEPLWRYLMRPNFTEELAQIKRAKAKVRNSAQSTQISKQYPDTRDLNPDDLFRRGLDED